MYCEKIDLYEYFKIEKPLGADGTLSVCCHGLSKETGLDRKRPAMLVIPGGAYVMVSDREDEPVAVEYFRHGFNTFSLRYSVAPCTYPTQLREAAMAMIFIRENAEKYGVMKDWVAAIGFSAGGHLCGCLGNMFDCEAVSDLRHSEYIRPEAVILSYPVLIYSEDHSKCHFGSFDNVSGHDERLMKYLSLDKHVKTNSSPAFIWHTVDDEGVPVYGSLVTAQCYLEKKVPFEMHLFRSAFHGASICTEEVYTVYPDVRPWVELSVTWLKGTGFKIYS